MSRETKLQASPRRKNGESGNSTKKLARSKKGNRTGEDNYKLNITATRKRSPKTQVPDSKSIAKNKPFSSNGAGSENLFLDTIRIKRVKVAGKHGVTERERSVSRPLIIDVEIGADLSKAAHTDNIVDTVNYSTVHKLILNIVETQSHRLLESLANAIIETMFEDQRIVTARIRISKPERLDGATPSVTISRENPGR